jgi:choice-of-anchor B domain-containing protein
MRRFRIQISLAFVLGIWASHANAQSSLHMTQRDLYPAVGMRGCWGYEFAGREYALACVGDRLDIIDCTNPDSIYLVKSVPSTSGDLKEVKTYQYYAYAINQFGPMQIINMANPATAYTEAHFSNASIPAGHTIYIDQAKAYAYVSLNGAGARDMRILDISFPTLPFEVGHYTHPDQGMLFADAHDSYAANNIAYVSYLDGGFVILDVASKAAPKLLAKIQYPGTTSHNLWPDQTGQYLFTTDERSAGHIRVWDIRDTKDINEVGSYSAAPLASVHNVHNNGDFSFMSYYTEGVRVLDIEDPADPIEVAYFDTYPVSGGTFSGCWGVYPYTSSGSIYASDRTYGLYALTWDSTKAGRVRGTVTLAHNGQPAEGATVTKVSKNRYHVTDSTGFYDWRIGVAADTFVIQRPGFYPETLYVTGQLGVVQTMNAALQPRPRAQVVGKVRNVGGFGLSGAKVGVMGGQLFEATAGPDGSYVLDFVLADSDQVIQAALWGYKFDTIRVNLAPGVSDTVNFTLSRGYKDNFELELGWTSGAVDDNATSGFWERGDPIGSQNFAAYQTQPETDFDPAPGTNCLFTGQAFPNDPVTVADVDGGHTSILSPFINLQAIGSPVLNLQYWYVNNAGANPSRDTLWFDISTDSGQTWYDVASNPYPLNNWWPLSINLATYQNWPQPILFRIRAADTEGESVIEAAMDAFEITGTYVESLAGDVDQSGTVTSADIIYLINYVFKAGPEPQPANSGDVNGTCTITAADVIYLVNYVFKGGPDPQPGCVG